MSTPKTGEATPWHPRDGFTIDRKNGEGWVPIQTDAGMETRPMTPAEYERALAWADEHRPPGVAPADTEGTP